MGQGSIFRVECLAPAAERAGQEIQRPARDYWVPIATTGGQEDVAGLPKVLIAEDNPDMAEHIAALLENVYTCRFARDGANALELAHSWSPDLLIADVMMPRMDGFTLCKRIKADPATLRLPVILLSALTHREALLEGWNAGADEYLFKPFHPEELVTRVRSVLAAHQSRQRQELSELSARLIAAQEDERRRVARELHDSLGNQIAALRVAVASISRKTGSPEIQMISQVLGGMAKATRELSHQLHPVVLEVAGLVPALRELCREFGELTGITATLSEPLELPSPPADVGLCAYRIVQEALQNVAKHSGAQAVEVSLSREDGRLLLTARDHGKGFDLNASKPRGLGFVSMRERVCLLKGALEIKSEVGQGTTILVSLPC